MSSDISHVLNAHVERTETRNVVQEDTESLTQSVSRNFFNGMLSGTAGQVISSSQKPIPSEMPTTKALQARLIESQFPHAADTIVLAKHNTQPQPVVASCWGLGFHHPMDFHRHDGREEWERTHKPYSGYS